MDDLISRQAVIDMVKGWNLNQHIMNEEDALDDVNALPSAEPKTPSNGSITSINPENTHDRTMGDCISRKDAIKSMANAIWHYPNELYTGLNSYEMSEALAKDGLMFLPSTEPEIIRCKDCKHYHLEAGDDSYALGYCPFIGSHLVMSKGFCAWGERREE